MRILLPGYARIESPRARGIALESCRSALESILANETIYDFAARQPGARRFTGRAPVYAFELPDGSGDAVVRRSMRGGALSRLHTDLFLPPTRGLRELLTSLRLRAAGVPTPEVMGYAVYPVGGIFRRTDVITRELKGGADLATLLSATDRGSRRSALLEAVAQLVAALSRAGAHHSDLNLRNILVTESAGAEAEAPEAHVLDVDRVRFHVPGDPIVSRANIDRLGRSIRKWRELHGLKVDDAEIATLRSRALENSR